VGSDLIIGAPQGVKHTAAAGSLIRRGLEPSCPASSRGPAL